MKAPAAIVFTSAGKVIEVTLVFPTYFTTVLPWAKDPPTISKSFSTTNCVPSKAASPTNLKFSDALKLFNAEQPWKAWANME